METHVKVLGILYICFSLLGVVAALVVLTTVVGGGMLSGDPEALRITSIVGPAVAGFLLLLSLPGLVGGIGLLGRRPWARLLVLVLGFFQLINIPFGTALAIYTLWVLFQRETGQLFGVSPEATSGPVHLP